MKTRRIHPSTRFLRRCTGGAAGLVLAATLLTGCSTQGASTNCGTNSCTITFDRGVEASANVLGVEAKLVGVDGNSVTVEVAGEQISLWTDEPATEVAGLSVKLERVDNREATIRIGRP